MLGLTEFTDSIVRDRNTSLKTHLKGIHHLIKNPVIFWVPFNKEHVWTTSCKFQLFLWSQVISFANAKTNPSTPFPKKESPSCLARTSYSRNLFHVEKRIRPKSYVARLLPRKVISNTYTYNSTEHCFQTKCLTMEAYRLSHYGGVPKKSLSTVFITKQKLVSECELQS